MQKTDFIAEVARHTGMSQKAVSKALNGAIDVITQALINDQRVTLTGFGTFEVRRRSERGGVHPKTRQRMTIAATKTPGFTPGNALREAVRATNEVEAIH